MTVKPAQPVIWTTYLKFSIFEINFQIPIRTKMSSQVNNASFKLENLFGMKGKGMFSAKLVQILMYTSLSNN